MSQRILETHQVAVTSFCGPDSRVEHTRMRLQIDPVDSSGPLQLGYSDVQLLRDALNTWLRQYRDD